mmetsp:Transcript_3240/g.11746  ORF Transcript_3240/g.11746 Transcript_3240/m.11746 type:complete len:238 (-) Transcript_3240:1548-2261(-)
MPGNAAARPTTAWELVATVTLVTCSVFEFVVWTADPFGVHFALSDFQHQPLSHKLIPAAINTTLFAIPAIAILYDIAALFAAGIPVLSFATVMYTQFWILPYLGNIGKFQMIKEHKDQLSRLPRWLPPIGDNLVPDIEHTLLGPLLLITLLSTIMAFSQNPKSARVTALLVRFGVVTAAPLVLTIASAPAPSAEQDIHAGDMDGFMIALGLHVCICGLCALISYNNSLKEQARAKKR